MSNRTLIVAYVSFLFSAPSAIALCKALPPLWASYNKPSPYIETLMKMPEEKIDVLTVAINTAGEFYPVGVRFYSGEVDVLVLEVGRRVGPSMDPLRRIRVINAVLFEQEGYDYDMDAILKRKTDAGFLNNLILRKQGNCFSIPTLYMAVAQRLGYPVYPVFAPSHMFLRYVDPAAGTYNIEATNYGALYTDWDYVDHFAITEEGIVSGSYLRTATYREYLGHLLDQSASLHGDRGNLDKAIALLEKAVQLDPLSAMAFNNLAYYHALLGYLNEEGSAESKSHLKKSDLYTKQAEDLGFVSLKDTPVWKQFSKEYGL